MATKKVNIDIVAKDRSQQALRQVRGGLDGVKKAVFNVRNALIGLGGGLVIKSLVNTGKEIESLQVRLKFLFGSTEEGAKAFDTLVKFAGKVPFTLQEIAQASGNLAVVSKDADELGKNLELVGNIAAVTGLDFRITAEQIQRSLSAGIASAEIFRERGVREMLGFTAGTAVTLEETKKKLDEVFGPNGKFGEAAKFLGTTFDGTLSMIQDKIFQFQLGTNQAGFFDFIKGGLITVNELLIKNQKQLNDFANRLGKGLVAFIEEAIVGFVGLLNATKVVFKTIIAGIAGVVDIINFLPPVVRELGILGFLTLGTKGRVLVLALGLIINQVKKLLQKMGVDIDLSFGSLEKVEESTKNIRGFFDEVRANIEKNTIATVEFGEKIAEANAEAAKLKRNISPFRKELEDLNNKSLKDLTTLSKQAFEIIEMGIKGMSQGLAENIVTGKDLKGTFQALADQILIKILSTLIEIAAKIALQVVLEQTAIANLLVKLGIEQQITAEKEKQNKAQKDKVKLQLVSTLLGVPMMASGGSVMKGMPTIVGERGPELFFPNSSGQITQNARGTQGRSAVVNFNINTIDSRGFDEALVENRGTITAIINNALTERGRGELV